MQLGITDQRGRQSTVWQRATVGHWRLCMAHRSHQRPLSDGEQVHGRAVFKGGGGGRDHGWVQPPSGAELLELKKFFVIGDEGVKENL